MLKQLIKFYHISTPATPLKKDKKKLKRLQWATFLSATAGYGIYYVCRLSLNVVKKPIVEEGIFSETELGIIGSITCFTLHLWMIDGRQPFTFRRIMKESPDD